MPTQQGVVDTRWHLHYLGAAAGTLLDLSHSPAYDLKRLSGSGRPMHLLADTEQDHRQGKRPITLRHRIRLGTKSPGVDALSGRQQNRLSLRTPLRLQLSQTGEPQGSEEISEHTDADPLPGDRLLRSTGPVGHVGRRTVRQYRVIPDKGGGRPSLVQVRRRIDVEHTTTGGRDDSSH